MDINWYPGHMAKAKRLMEDNLRLVDIIIELLDARAPRSSVNPDLQKLYANKMKLIVLAKSDFADRDVTQEWIEYFKDNGENAIAANCIDNRSMNRVRKWIDGFAQEKRKEYRERRGINKTIRAMVVGIPNVGKSTFINAMSGGRKAKVGDRPGVTRGKQWIGVNQYFELLDTPGVLWPKIEDRNIGMNLAYLGSIRDELIDFEELAVKFIETIEGEYPGYILSRYELHSEDRSPIEILYDICKARGWLAQGGEVNVQLGAKRIIKDFQQGRLGSISLERPD